MTSREPFDPTSADQLEALARDLRQAGDDTFARIDESDHKYMRRVIRAALWCEIAGRGCLFLSHLLPFWLSGVSLLALSKILDNMEVGHNVMHRQYEATGDPDLAADRYELDAVPTSAGWRHAHNRVHHGRTGIVGEDEDVGMLRLGPERPWRPVHLLQPLVALVTALFSQWAVAAQNIGLGHWFQRRKTLPSLLRDSRPTLRKAARQVGKDYLLFPVLAGPNMVEVLLGNLAANGVRNVWSWLVIICNHCPPGVRTFTREEIDRLPGEHWYYRQIRATANFEAPSWLHVLSGHLGYHIEHHLFPRLPSTRLPELAARVRAICARHGIIYNSAPFGTQARRTIWRIFRYSFP